MKTAKTLQTIAIGLALALIYTTPVLAAGDDGNANITPVVTVAPTLFAAGKASNAYLCVSKGCVHFLETTDGLLLVCVNSLG